MPDAITKRVHIHVDSEYLEEESQPDKESYVFTYHITISNHGQEPVQLISRHWVITNADGITEEIQGPGVVGQQPVISPGTSYNYTSFCPLNTPVGSMQGTYHMITGDRSPFEAVIPPFTLAVPGSIN
jgi:ApaG protein